jgi:hypothetical protein
MDVFGYPSGVGEWKYEWQFGVPRWQEANVGRGGAGVQIARRAGGRKLTSPRPPRQWIDSHR